MRLAHGNQAGSFPFAVPAFSLVSKGIFITLGSSLLYGFAPVICSFSYQLGNNPYTMAFLRSVFVIPVLHVLCHVKGIGYSLPLQRLPDLLIAGVFSIMTTWLLYMSYAYLGVGTAVSIHFLYPLFTLMICRYAFHDTVSKVQLRSLLIASAGLLLFVNPHDITNVKGVLIAACSGLCYAMYLVWLEKRRLSEINDLKLSYYLAIIASSFLLVLNLFTRQLVWVQPAESYFYVFLVAMCTSFLASVLLKKGIGLIGSAKAGFLCLAEPVLSMIFGIVFLHEPFLINKALGCIVIVWSILTSFKRRA